MSQIVAVVIATAIVAVPISFAVRCAGALFSKATRERIAVHPGRHIVWGLVAGLVVTYLVVGNLMTSRMVEDLQREIAEQVAAPLPRAPAGRSEGAR